MGVALARHKKESKEMESAASMVAISWTVVTALITTLREDELNQIKTMKDLTSLKLRKEGKIRRSTKWLLQMEARSQAPQVLILLRPTVKKKKQTSKKSKKMMMAKITSVRSMLDSISQDQDHSLRRDQLSRDTHQQWRMKVPQYGHCLVGKLKRESSKH